MAVSKGVPSSPSSLPLAGASPIADSKQPHPEMRVAKPESPRVPQPGIAAEVAKFTGLPNDLARLIAAYNVAPRAPAILQGSPERPDVQRETIEALASMDEEVRPKVMLVGEGQRQIPARIVLKEGEDVTVAIPAQAAVSLGLLNDRNGGYGEQEVQYLFNLDVDSLECRPIFDHASYGLYQQALRQLNGDEE